MNALVGMYAKVGSLVDSLFVCNEMKNLDIVSWNAIMAASVLHEHYGSARIGEHNFYLDGKRNQTKIIEPNQIHQSEIDPDFYNNSNGRVSMNRIKLEQNPNF